MVFTKNWRPKAGINRFKHVFGVNFSPQIPGERGTTYLDEGDPETPFYPSIPGAYRWTREKVEAGLADKHDLPGLPNIPIQPIGYGDALKFLKRMKGVEVPGNYFQKFKPI